MARQFVLSSSSISLFLECPRCFWLHINRNIRRPEGIFPSLPSGMDRVLKNHFDMHRKEGSVPEELEGKFHGRLFADMGKLDVWRNSRKGLRFTDRDGNVLMGAIDDLFVTGDGCYAPLDFKTRGYPRKEDTHGYYQHQMDIYSLLLEKNGMKAADFAILVFYHPVKVNEKCHVEMDPDPLRVPVSARKGMEHFVKALECLNGEEPGPTKGCQWCSWGFHNAQSGRPGSRTVQKSLTDSCR